MSLMASQITDNSIIYCAENIKTHITGNLGVESTNNRWITITKGH